MLRKIICGVGDEGGRITLDFPSVPARPVGHTDADGRDWTVYLPSPQVTAMAEDEAYLWAGTAAGGVWRIGKQNPREMTAYTTFDGGCPEKAGCLVRNVKLERRKGLG